MDTLNDSEKRPHPESVEDPAVVKKIKTDETADIKIDSSSQNKPEDVPAVAAPVTEQFTENRAGVAPVKAEFLVPREKKVVVVPAVDDDAAEASPRDARDSRDSRDGGRKKKDRGQNKARRFHFANDEVKLCQSLVLVQREGRFETSVCQFAANAPKDEFGNKKPKKGGRGHSKKQQDSEVVEPTRDATGEGAEAGPAKGTERCHFEHNLREYLKHKKPDVEGVCSIWEKRGTCASGWRCRWLGSHSKEEDGELVLTWDEEREQAHKLQKTAQREKKFGSKPVDIGDSPETEYEKELGVANFEDPYGEIVNNVPMSVKIQLRKDAFPIRKTQVYMEWQNNNKEDPAAKAEERAAYVEPPRCTEEKRNLYFDRDTPVLAPLTTTGNLPFRRLCIAAGAAVTYSEMAMSSSLLQGHKPEWALLRAHTEELPHFGAQICANKVQQAVRATEVLTTLFPTSARNRHGLALIDLNCGCPIDLVYRAGGGSALLDQQSKLVKMLKGMNYVSGTTPITCKIRTGAKESNPTAQKLIGKLLEAGDVQAITLHGRSRQQRYSRAADWGYIADTAALIKGLKEDMHNNIDAAASKENRDKKNVFFIGNGDCFSHIDYYNAVDNAKVDTVMVARGALIKPWIFEEIKTGQYLDKSATERLDMVRDYCRNGLECWGSDEYGVATTRRFLMEWLSFTCRYVPLGILETLPPKIQDRPPLWKGRNELETLLGSQDYRDWIKISEMFLGPCPADFFFTPKHKSNAHGETEAEG